LAESLQVVAGDSAGAAPLLLRWARLSPYAAAGTFESRIFDTGAAHATATDWAADVPQATDVELEMRGGDTPQPDASWLAYVHLGSTSSVMPFSRRYLQYRATLTSSDPRVTPELRAAAAAGGAAAAAPLGGRRGWRPRRGAAARARGRPRAGGGAPCRPLARRRRAAGAARGARLPDPHRSAVAVAPVRIR